MKKTPIFLTVLLILAIGLGTTFYLKLYQKKDLTVWDVMPSQTVLVFEVGECEECLQSIRGTALLTALTESIFQGYRKAQLTKLISNFLEPKNSPVISLHVVKKDDFDFIFYAPLSKSNQIELQLKELEGEAKKFSQREFNGVQIKELPIDDKLFSWVAIDGIWVGSFTPFLVEDVIRTYKSDRSLIFKNDIREVALLPTVKNDAGNIYINLKEFSNWLTVFSDNQSTLTTVGQGAVLDIKQRQGNLTLNGFSIANNEDQNMLLSSLKQQTPVPFMLKSLISNRSVLVTSFGISDGSELFKNIELSRRKDIQDSIQSFSNVDLESIFSGLGKEIVTCYLESGGQSMARVVLFSSSNSKEWLKSFDLLSKASEKGDSLYIERFSSYEIRQIEINNLPEKLFKPLVNGFRQIYYTNIDNTILFSDRVDELRKFLDDIDKEEVWGKSVYYNQFLESTLLESNYSIYINTPRALAAVSNSLNTKWNKVYSSTNRSYFNAIGLGAIQFSHLNENFYTNIAWSFNPQSDVGRNEPQEIRDRLQVNLDYAIASKPFVVRNHASKRDEYVLQDSLFVLHYFSTDGKRQWKKEIQSKLVGTVVQIDYLNNNKLQLFLVTAGKIHVIDRLGNYVNPFPVSVPQQNIEFVSVIDYDNSKKYRFLISEKTGKLWMYDQEGRNLEGWKPRNVEGPLVTAPSHHRIRGKDFILAVRQDGWAYLMNRRGENIKGFPLNLDMRPGGTYFLEQGNTLAASNFVIVSKDGVKVKFNVEGTISSREPLIRTSVDDQFSLIAENNNRFYVIARQNAKELTLLNENGKAILVNEFVGKNQVDIQYYSFGSGNDYIVVSDKIQDLSYVYDGTGRLLTPIPLESTGITLKQENQKVSAIYVNDKTLTILPL
ncbi:MAG: hypothetical protein KIT51_04545 [Cyclobacteriaceae bacterium]|nr:MAG: hypothetical protein KIT51_04545 [Cyclobacteriaceae bacterium]